MNCKGLDLTIEGALSDPVIGAMMRADRVEPSAARSLASGDGAAPGNHPARPEGSARRRDPGAAPRRLRGILRMVGFFTSRPIFASAVAIIMVMAGAICYVLLPVSQFPDITPPQVVVSAVYPGASAQVVADTVTTPLEQQINGVAGMTYMSSSSSNDGSATITVTFDVGYPLSIAAVDVQNRVSQAASSLPAIVNQAGVTIKKQNPNFVLIVNLTSPDGSVDPVALSNYAYLQIVDPLKRLPGVGDVQIFGERRYSMRVWLDPDRLANLGITAVDVQSAIAEQNVQVAAGKIGQSPAPAGTAFEMQVNAVGRLSDPAQFGDIVVRADPATGSVVRLRDVARIELGALQYASSAFFGKDPTVVLAVYQMPGSNALALQKGVKDKMEELKQRFPKGIDYAMHYDTTRFVSASMHDVVITLGEALILVILVVYVFLQSWRTTIIPTIAIPVSLVATLAVMEICGFSLNMLSLLGMVLAIGLVVDDAIVVVENVERQLEAGLPPMAATRKAMSEVTGPDHRHHGGADGGVRAGGLHPGRRGAALQPVRPDGGDLGRHLGLQLADAQPGPERRLPAPPAASALHPVPLVQCRLRAAVALSMRAWCAASSGSAGP